MTTDRYTAWLDDYVDETLPLDDHHDVSAHLETCDACRTQVAELRALLDLAADLPHERLPGRDLWDDIDARLAPESRQALPWQRLALAAAVLIAATAAATTWLVQPDPAGPTAAPAMVAVTDVPAPDWQASMRNASTALAQALDARRDILDPEALAVIEHNLAVIDQAIAECEAALGTDPDNALLARTLLASWQRKVDLLERAARLPTAS